MGNSMRKVYLHDLGSYEFRLRNNLIDWDLAYEDMGVDRKTNNIYDEPKFVLAVIKYGVTFITPTLEEWQEHNRIKQEETKPWV